ncbi:ABC transporter ATP-binding protein/permease [Enterococcus sp. 5H]|uniref:ABC transporter ATP-binding protein/permease n=1 Tax=Enterococcus sp. 5H TaxID=1229490 RepID=UPI0023048AB2|nr:ABC transporter ATP-binding protein/permease [Enterococcus sp. 5H]
MQMIDKRLFQLTEKKNLFKLVIARLIYLAASIIMWWVIAEQLANYLLTGEIMLSTLLVTFIGTLLVKILLTWWMEQLTYQASSELRLAMRQAVMEKAFRLGKSQGQLSSAALAKLSVDGIEQLEIYYARFLPQLFYCLFASLLIFGALVSFAWQPAVVLLVCMPLIPLIIMSVMKIAKRILSGYWTQYTDLGARFHENLSGLSTLKAYDQDGNKQNEAVLDAERFRKVTMSLLSMQLNSITIMDIVSYCGAALGIGLALFAYAQSTISLTGMFLFILLSAEFFIPMRQLGSLFHVAMNGISACKKLFSYLELPEQTYGEISLSAPLEQLKIERVYFKYEEAETEVLQNLSFTVKRGEFTALVGKSGSGKSTVVRLLLHQLSQYQGDIYWNDVELRELSKTTVKQKSILVDNHGYVYPTSIKENLLLGNKLATDEELWAVLEKVQLASFVKKLPEKLLTILDENGGNLSGGQRQRLLLARALLRDAELYVFDEITSGIDLKSEEIILACLKELARVRLVIFISHRLYNVLNADQVLVFDKGELVEMGAPAVLQEESMYFKNYFKQEQSVISGGEQ